MKERTGGHQSLAEIHSSRGSRRAGKNLSDVSRSFGGRHLSDEGQDESSPLQGIRQFARVLHSRRGSQTNWGCENRNPNDATMIHGKNATSGTSSLVLICREIKQSLEFQAFDLLQGFAGDALKVAVHT